MKLLMDFSQQGDPHSGPFVWLGLPGSTSHHLHHPLQPPTSEELGTIHRNDSCALPPAQQDSFSLWMGTKGDRNLAQLRVIPPRSRQEDKQHFTKISCLNIHSTDFLDNNLGKHAFRILRLLNQRNFVFLNHSSYLLFLMFISVCWRQERSEPRLDLS